MKQSGKPRFVFLLCGQLLLWNLTIASAVAKVSEDQSLQDWQDMPLNPRGETDLEATPTEGTGEPEADTSGPLRPAPKLDLSGTNGAGEARLSTPFELEGEDDDPF